MSKKTTIFIYVAIAIIVIALVVFYRKNLLPDSLNEKIDNLMETNYTKNFIDVANSQFNSAVISNSFVPVAKNWYAKAVANKAIYQRIASAVNAQMPWYFIAAIHSRESDMNFNTHLYNGDSLNTRTVNVPSGRPKAAPKNGTRYTFEESAIDTLLYKGLHKWNDWSIAGMIYLLEKYNGWGYRYRKLASPYVWSGTQHYKAGKFVADGKFSSTTVDKQIGAAALLKYFIQNNS